MANEHSRLLSARYGATVARLRRIFLIFPLQDGDREKTQH